jgi:CheY-like chemotaxis protein/signal transduction histidine kinase
MLSGVQNELITKLNELFEFAKRGDDDLPDEICNFLSTTFDLDAAVIFNINNDSSLTVLGRTLSAKKNYSRGNSFQCGSCKLINENTNYSVDTQSNCQLQISEFVVYEACSLLILTPINKLLIKFAKKNPIAKTDKDSIDNILRVLHPYVLIWFQVRGNILPVANTSFAKIVADTTGELRTNANSIIGYLSLLAEENQSYSNNEFVATIRKNTQSILLNINDLTELSKIESKILTKNLRKLNLASLIEETILLFKSKINNQHVKFSFEVDEGLKKPINIDEHKLRYILINLLYVSTTLTEYGEISVKANILSKNTIRIIIEDNGKGLESGILNNFFEPFSVSKDAEFKSSSVTGLSLTLVKKYVNFLGGEISAASEVGKGNTFTFTFNGEVMSSLESTLSQLPKPTSKNKVLVIEDDYATSKLLSNYLNKWGYDPTIVSTEQQALNIIEKEPLLAVILDIEIPNANGLELLKKIHDHHNTKNVPVIVCSIEPDQQKAFMMGAVEYFIKPINYNYLVEVLTSYKLRKDSNVLCVDDDFPTLNLVKQAIESAGFNAIAENVSANVMDLIRDKSIDLAIVDLDMPTPNGFELIKLIKSEKRFAHLPIIIYTGKENYKDDLYKIEGLFEELLDKRATNIEDLADTINLMINRYDVPPPVEEVISKKGGIKILLAEDYKHSQIIVTRLLKKNNFEDIVVVENGEEAYKIAQKEKFDLILMDMQMPIMNGFEATEKIRQMADYKSTPIIALTAFAMKGDREKCLEAGATDYIPKPIDSKEFIDKVKYYTNA